MNEMWLMFILMFTGIDCTDPRYLCSVVETKEVTHISMCPFPFETQGMMQPMPWMKWELDDHVIWIQTTNCIGT